MKVLRFANEHPYTGHKALVSVRLIGAPVPMRLNMVIDSGAEVTVMHRELLAVLGIDDVTTGIAIQLMVANKESQPAWIHRVEIECFGRRMTIDAAFCPAWDMKNLLGMRGFFDQVVIAFDHAEQRLYA
jgi:predicted aspartyl protease